MSALPYVGLVLLLGFTVLLLRPRRFVRRAPDAALRALLRHVQGDRTIATRLARLELERAPDLTDEQAIARALARLERARR